MFIGVHAPEFKFAHDKRQVEAAVRRLGIDYPVVLDNDYQTWDAFANRYWPTVYLIDGDGYIRFQHHGEGGYEKIEAALQALVLEVNPQAALPRPLGALRSEDRPGAVCFRTTPELHAGYDRGALGNPEGYAPRSLPMIYRMPPRPNRADGAFYVEGTWQAGDSYLAFAGQKGRLILPYHAATANAVLAPAADPVELMLDLKPPVTLIVTQDGRALDPLSVGEDIALDGGQSLLTVDAPRMYQIARNPDGRPHELEFRLHAPGLAVYAFSFSSCTV